jgi:hypothetical protein
MDAYPVTNMSPPLYTDGTHQTLTETATLAEFMKYLYESTTAINMSLTEIPGVAPPGFPLDSPPEFPPNSRRRHLNVLDVWSGYVIPKPWFDLERVNHQQWELSQAFLGDCFDVLSEVMHPKSTAFALMKKIDEKNNVSLAFRLYVAVLEASSYHLKWDIFWWAHGRPTRKQRIARFKIEMDNTSPFATTHFTQMWSIISRLGQESAWVDFNVSGNNTYETVNWFTIFVSICVQRVKEPNNIVDYKALGWACARRIIYLHTSNFIPLEIEVSTSVLRGFYRTYVMTSGEINVIDWRRGSFFMNGFKMLLEPTHFLSHIGIDDLAVILQQ